MRWRASLAAIVAIGAFLALYRFVTYEPPPPPRDPRLEPIEGLFSPAEDWRDSPILTGGDERSRLPQDTDFEDPPPPSMRLRLPPDDTRARTD